MRTPTREVAATVALLLCWSPATVMAREIGRLRLALTPPVAFLAAACAAAPISALLLRRHILGTFAHEMGHMVVALLTRGRVHEFRASETDGGHVRHSGPLPFLVSIAPYAFPMLAIGLCVVSGLMHPRPSLAWAVAIGAALGFHVGLAWDDARQNMQAGWQATDFRHGLFVTGSWILLSNLVVAGLLLGYCTRGTPGAPRFLHANWALLLKGGRWLAGLVR